MSLWVHGAYIPCIHWYYDKVDCYIVPMLQEERKKGKKGKKVSSLIIVWGSAPLSAGHIYTLYSLILWQICFLYQWCTRPIKETSWTQESLDLGVGEYIFTFCLLEGSLLIVWDSVTLSERHIYALYPQILEQSSLLYWSQVMTWKRWT